MDYVSHLPAPPLDQYVDDLYCLTGVPAHRPLNVPPMPSAHLVLNLGESIVLHDSEPGREPVALADGWFMGVWTRRFVLDYPASVRVVGVHFKPWGMAPFITVPSHELADRCVPVGDVWGQPAADRIRDRAASATATGEALQVLEDELRARLAPAPPRGLDLVQHTGGHLEAAWGDVSVAALTDGAGMSVNHLAHQFTSHLGVAPKRVARIYRFAGLILSVDPQGPVDWAALAHTAGYFDQAHMSREFKDFTGHTPTGFLELRRRFPPRPGFPPDSGPMPAE